jgi:fumarate hydratase class I
MPKKGQSVEGRRMPAAHGGLPWQRGRAAARLAQDCIRKVEFLEFPELGMEAVWRIEVEHFPAFIVMDDKGNDFYDGLG